MFRSVLKPTKLIHGFSIAVLVTLLASQAWAARGDCCQPISNGAGPAVSDCLHILRTAVGLSTCEPACICAPRGTLPTLAGDALTCLLVAVGRSSQLECPCLATSTTTSSLPTTTSSTTSTTFNPTLTDEWIEGFDASSLGWMMSAWGPGDGSLWVVGGKLFDGGVIFKQTASGWNEIDPGFDIPLLNWVHGTAHNDVFAGGYDGSIVHYDGQSWTRQSTPVTGPIWGIWAVASDDVWAVGDAVDHSKPPFVIHYDGESWSNVALPVLERPGVHALYKIWGSGPDNIYAVGENGAVLHWDGESFEEMGLGVSQDLVGIWGTDADNIMIVGGRSTAELLHYDGDSWMKAPPSALPGLNGVWLRNSTVAHVVGTFGTILTVDPSTLAITVDTSPSDLQLHAIFGDARDQLIAVGANFQLPEAGVVLLRELADDE